MVRGDRGSFARLCTCINCQRLEIFVPFFVEKGKMYDAEVIHAITQDKAAI